MFSGKHRAFARGAAALAVVAALWAYDASAGGLSIEVTRNDERGGTAVVHGTCPAGYELQTENTSWTWTPDQTWYTVRASCQSTTDPSISCWTVTRAVRNPGKPTPTPGGPTAEPKPTTTPAADCPLCTATPEPTPEANVVPGQPAPTPPAGQVPAQPTPAPASDGTAVGSGGPASGPCPNSPNGMPSRWVERDGRSVPICEEISAPPAPRPAASVVGQCVVRDGLVSARFDVRLDEGEIAYAAYRFSQGGELILKDESWSPDERRSPMPPVLEVPIPAGQRVALDLVVVGYDDNLRVSSNEVSGDCLEQAQLASAGQVAAVEPVAAGVAAQPAVFAGQQAGGRPASVPVRPLRLPNTAGDDGNLFWLVLLGMGAGLVGRRIVRGGS